MKHLSVVLPTSGSFLNLLQNTLMFYSRQTRKDFDVVIVDDGGPHEKVQSLAGESWPFPVRYYVSPRIENPNLAHKNHARNVGWHNAVGDVVFICDCDFIVRPDFVENVFLLHAAAEKLGGNFCLYPPCAMFLTEPKLDPASGKPIEDQINWSHSYDPFLQDYTALPDATPALRKIEAHPEGMHILDRRLLEILGGLDEEFFGWGGNKMELQQRINETPIRQYLLEGCILFHQPHEHSGDNHKREEIKATNRGLMARKSEERKTSPDWKRRVQFLGAEQGSPNEVEMEWIESEIPPCQVSKGDWRIRRKILRDCEPWKPVAFIGPWVGEFGWEVCRWQGGIRKHATQYLDSHRVIVCGDPGHHVFYDYAHEFWELPPAYYQQMLTRESQRTMPEGEAKKVNACIKGLLAREMFALNAPELVVALPTFDATRSFIGEHDQDVIRLEPSAAAELEACEILKSIKADKYVCLFPRQRPINKVKNWPEKNWIKLIDWLQDRDFGVVVMGRQEDTAALASRPGVISTMNVQPDRRLDLNIAILSEAFAAISSESGGPFLAMLCGCPVFVMGGMEWKDRYENSENFLNSPCRYIEAENYNHPYESVIKDLGNWMPQYPPPFKHILITRFNLPSTTLSPTDVGNQEVLTEEWLRHRVELFERICLPSVRAQTCQDFGWMLFLAKDSPPWLLERAEEWRSSERPISMLLVDTWEDVPGRIVAWDDPDYLITTRLDNDDAIAPNFIRTIQANFEGRDVFINLQHGQQVDESGNKIADLDSLICNPFLTRISRRQQNGNYDTVIDCQHGHAPRHGDVVHVTGGPYWSQTIHERNLCNRPARHVGPVGPPGIAGDVGFEYSKKWYEEQYHGMEYDLANKTFADLDAKWKARPHYARTLEVFDAVDMNGVKRALEIGSHHAKTMFWLAEKYPQIEQYIGIDFSSTSVEWCKENNPMPGRLEFYEADIRDWPSWRNVTGRFDLITCIDFTEHLPRELMRPLKMLCANYLADDGMLVLYQGRTRADEHINIYAREADLIAEFEPEFLLALENALPHQHHTLRLSSHYKYYYRQD